MGLEVVITLVCTLLTTVAIARVIGPSRLGYFNLIFWLTSITCSVGSLGIPLTTFKYMGEFLGGGKKELARAVFFYNLRAQTVIACVLTSIGLIAALILVDPAYRVCSILLVLSMVPNMITFAFAGERSCRGFCSEYAWRLRWCGRLCGRSGSESASWLEPGWHCRRCLTLSHGGAGHKNCSGA